MYQFHEYGNNSRHSGLFGQNNCLLDINLMVGNLEIKYCPSLMSTCLFFF